MILMIDNYDSFTYNLVQYLGELGMQLKVFRNDQVTLTEIRRLRPKWIIISPGPGTPRDAGVSCDVIRTFGEKIPILGVCLGHQCIGEVFGGKVVRAKRLMHGKTSPIHHKGKTLFKGIPNPFHATRYHSLIVQRQELPDALEVTAWTEDYVDREIMGLKHKRYPIWGLQFHPESILTDPGMKILGNFLKYSKNS